MFNFWRLMCGSCHFDRLSNFEIGVEFWNVYLVFLFFAGSKRRMNCSAIFLLKSLNFFYFLKLPQNTFHNKFKKNTTTKIFRYLTPISTFNALSKWHDPRMSEVILCLFFDIWRKIDSIALKREFLLLSKKNLRGQIHLTWRCINDMDH